MKRVDMLGDLLLNKNAFLNTSEVVGCSKMVACSLNDSGSSMLP